MKGEANLDRAWREIDTFVQKRSVYPGDVYGWGKGVDEEGAFAYLLVDDRADASSFPEAIDQVPIRLRFVPEPQLEGTFQ